MDMPNHRASDSGARECAHGVDAWTICEDCLSDLLDRGVLGRFDLIGLGGGVAVDIDDDGRVVVYMLTADTVVYGGGGAAFAWVSFDGRLTTEPDAVLARLGEPVRVATEQVADFCGAVSDLATALLPVLNHAVETDTAPEAFAAWLDTWMDLRGTKPHTRRLVYQVVRLLSLAVAAMVDREDAL